MGAPVGVHHLPQPDGMPLNMEAPPARANGVDDGSQRQVASMGSVRGLVGRLLGGNAGGGAK
jgi:hypothetical protein